MCGGECEERGNVCEEEGMCMKKERDVWDHAHTIIKERTAPFRNVHSEVSSLTVQNLQLFGQCTLQCSHPGVPRVMAGELHAVVLVKSSTHTVVADGQAAWLVPRGVQKERL